MAARPFALGRPPWLRGRGTGVATSTTTPSFGGPSELKPKAGQSGQRPLVKAAANAIIIALRGIKEGSPAAPLVQGVAGALLLIVETYKASLSNWDGTKPVPCERVLEWTMLIAEKAGTLQTQPWLLRVLNADDAAGEVESYAKTLTWYFHSFILESTMAVELNLHEMAQDMRSRMDLLSQQVVKGNEGLRDDLNRLGAAPIIGIKGALYSGLRPVVQARFDYGLSVHVQCDQDTRREVLATICSWLRPDDHRLATLPEPLSLSKVLPDSSILWIHGLAGFGKSTLAQTVATWWDEDKILGASFFCARDGDRSNVMCIFRTIAYQLACHFPGFHDALLDVLKADPDVSASFPTQQLKKLIVEPLKVVKARGDFPDRVVIVIDALDECTDDGAVSTILTSLSLHVSELAPLKFVITSRPEENITRGFMELENLLANTQHLSLTEIPRAIAKRDVANFLQTRVAEIRKRYVLGSHWLSPSQFDALLDLAGELFIYASTAILFIGDDGVRNPAGQLARLIEAGSSATTTPGRSSTQPLRKLDALYEQVLARAAEKLDATACARLKVILGTVTLAEERLSPTSIDALLNLQAGDVRRVLPVLNAVVNIPPLDEEHTPIRLIHLSFPNFLIDPSRCTSREFLVNSSLHHTYIALRCLRMLQSLQHNICGIPPEHNHLLNVNIPGLPDHIAQNLPPVLQYACKYWAFHLCRAELGEDLVAALEDFCKTHLLHWLEALSLMGCVKDAVDALQVAQVFLKASSLNMLSLPLPGMDAPDLLHDCERIVRAFYPAISASFFQVYKAAVVFSPTDSPLRCRHAAEASDVVRLVSGANKNRGTTLSSTLSPAGNIEAVDLSPDGRYIVSGHETGAIWLWNTQTGAPIVAFQGHTRIVRSVSFSPTGKEVLSGSDDVTVKLWDVMTETCLATLQKHSQLIRSVAWSPDGALAASGSFDKTVVLWRVTSDEEPAVLLGHEDHVNHVVFAADGILLSASEDKTSRIWDIHGKTAIRVLRHSSSVQCAAASSDGRSVACGLDTGEVVIWNRGDGHRLRSLANPTSTSPVVSLTFYLNHQLAAAYEYSSCTLWNVFSGELLKSEDSFSSSVAFSRDGVHIAHGWRLMTVQEWSPAHVGKPTRAASAWTYERTVGIVRRYRKRVLGFILGKEEGVSAEEYLDDSDVEVADLSLSPDRRLVLVAYPRRLLLLNASTGECVRTFERSGAGCRTAWTPAGDLRVIACTGKDYKVHVWETETGRSIATLAGHSDYISALCFVGDGGKQIVSASYDGTICRWTLDVGEDPPETSCEVLFRSDESIEALAVSSDGQWILSASTRNDSPPDTSSADLLAKPSRPPSDQPGRYRALRLLDASGHVLWIEHHHLLIFSVAFSEDCSRALAGNVEGEVFWYDLTQLIPLPSNDNLSPSVPPPAVQERKFNTGARDSVCHISFSPDSRGILTERSYTPLEEDLQPLCRRSAGSASICAYFLANDGWLWRISADSTHRRVSWVPSLLRPGFRSCWSASGNIVAYEGPQGQLVVMDTTRA
ncbi:hypothetical protein BN946_scf184983.g34 [Trametes cinnabarina]|uniref:NACHT domain-containing protein n=1 Tax=Pycnoporus cinnabarinus TaxID=5643 RepID=A0A060SE99_PYCCI|nr:hypothetical protein BN946_scf184983.g34 [Trametes cinnabarina]